MRETENWENFRKEKEGDACSCRVEIENIHGLRFSFRIFSLFQVFSGQLYFSIIMVLQVSGVVKRCAK